MFDSGSPSSSGGSDKEMTGRLYSALLNVLTGQVVLALVWLLALLPASLTPGGVSSAWLGCCSKLQMFIGCLIPFAKELEKFLVALG